MMKEILETMENQIVQSIVPKANANYQLLNHQSILDSFDYFHNDFQDTFISNHTPNSSGISIISSITQPSIYNSSFNININQHVDGYLNIDTNHINNYEDNDGLPGGDQSGSKNEEYHESAILNMNSSESYVCNAQTQKANNQSDSGETKNIPKNFIKAIFTYILQNKDNLIQNVFNHLNIDSGEIQRFMEFIGSERKIKKYTIQRLKNWWICDRYGKVMRIIFCRFLRKRSLSYIMTSKIEKKVSHLKYRQRFVRSMQRPQDFTNIK